MFASRLELQKVKETIKQLSIWGVRAAIPAYVICSKNAQEHERASKTSYPQAAMVLEMKYGCLEIRIGQVTDHIDLSISHRTQICVIYYNMIQRTSVNCLLKHYFTTYLVLYLPFATLA